MSNHPVPQLIPPMNLRIAPNQWLAISKFHITYQVLTSVTRSTSQNPNLKSEDFELMSTFLFSRKRKKTEESILSRRC